MIWVVTPCCRKKQLRWVFDRFKSQNYPDRSLCIVENGEAIGGCAELGLIPDLLVQSDALGVADARNAGMYAIRDRGGGWMCMWDDDDWYGPDYLSEMSGLSQSGKAEIYGKQRHFVALPGKGLFLLNSDQEHRYCDWLHGPSLTFRAEEGVVFKRQKEAEEITWCRQMHALGARIWTGSVLHLLYLRWQHQHTWEATDSHILLTGLDPVLSFGPVDLDIVTGARPWRECIRQVIPTQPLHPPMRVDEKVIPLRILPEIGA